MKRNKFSLSHYHLVTCDMGKLIPLTWYEVLPGDTIQQATSLLIRVSPLLSPVMHPVRVRVHHFFVPYRIIWDNFEEFITGGPDGTDSSTPPYKNINTAIGEGGLYNLLGIPSEDFTGQNEEISALPVRAYQMIWDEYYRDQDLGTAPTIDTTDGQDTTTSVTLQQVCWEKDYFTTSRPWETKGDTVTIPILGDAPITGIGWGSASATSGPINAYETDGSGAESYAGYRDPASSAVLTEEDPSNSGYPNIRANLAAATGVDINELRLALAIQRYQEARAQYGSRYVEYLRYLGVRSSDGRPDKPVYLGGGRNTIQFSEVLATDGSNTGDLYGHGISAMRTNRYRRFFEEHGLIMTMMSVIPKTIYHSQLPKKWSRTVKEHYYQKELASIGEQAVLNKEVHAVHANPDDTFGYQARYDEYRSEPSRISGEFESTLDHWHYARIFGSDPSLNSTFVEATPAKRVNASSGTDCLYVMSNHSIQARRMMPRIAKPRTF